MNKFISSLLAVAVLAAGSLVAAPAHGHRVPDRPVAHHKVVKHHHKFGKKHKCKKHRHYKHVKPVFKGPRHPKRRFNFKKH